MSLSQDYIDSIIKRDTADECKRVVDAIVKVNADAVNKAVDNAILYGFGTLTTEHEYQLSGNTTTFDKPPEAGSVITFGRFDDPNSWTTGEGWAICTVQSAKPRTLIFCAANDVDEMRRHYGSDYEVLAR